MSAWVKSRHLLYKKACPLYARKRTLNFIETGFKETGEQEILLP